MLTLILDESGHAIGSGDATGVPGYVPGPREIECTPEQWENPQAWRVLDGRIIAASPAPKPPPAVISSAQAKIQLRRSGLREKVEAAVAKADGEVQDWYAEARSWHRQNKYVVDIGKALGLTESDIDKLFDDASSIMV